MDKTKQAYIGLDIEITESKNASLKGIKGKIIDETKNTFKIRSKNWMGTVLKNTSTFKIDGNEINGKTIMKKPGDRIKNKGRKLKEKKI